MLHTITIHYWRKGISQFCQSIQQATIEFPAVQGFEAAVKAWEQQHPEADTCGISGLSPRLLPRLPSGVLDARPRSISA